MAEPRRHRLVQLVLDEMAKGGGTMQGDCARAGIARETVLSWKHQKRSPTLATLEPMLALYGYKLIAVKGKPE